MANETAQHRIAKIDIGFIIFILIITIQLTLCFCESGSCQETISQLTEQGNLAFKKGDYDKALTLYIKAEAQGEAGIHLTYNIGVCAFKTGSFSQARIAFMKVAEVPDLASLAFYNLGLVSMKEEKFAEAEKWFKTTLDTATNIKLQILATEALKKMQEEARPSWFGFSSLGLGYDDNVSTVYNGETRTTTGQGDAFSEILLFAKGPLAEDLNNVNMQINVYALSFQDLHASNYAAAALAVIYGRKLTGYSIETGVDIDYSHAGSDEYALISSIYAQTDKEFQQSYARLKYRFSFVDTLNPDYESLRGTKNMLSAEYGRQWDDFRAWIRYTLELNNRDSKDSSPTRHELKLKMYLIMTKQIKISAGSSIICSEYSMSDGTDYNEYLWENSLQAGWSFVKNWILSAEYRHSQNDSDISSYDYTRNIGTVSITMNY